MGSMKQKELKKDEVKTFSTQWIKNLHEIIINFFNVKDIIMILQLLQYFCKPILVHEEKNINISSSSSLPVKFLKVIKRNLNRLP